MGDLANGRTVRSLAYLLAKYQDVKIYFVSPNVVKMKVIVANTNYGFMSRIRCWELQDKMSYGFFFVFS